MIRFIAKPIFFRPGSNGGVYPARLSSRIRGEEIAEYLGGKYSIDGKYNKDDICIYLKPGSLERVRDNDYVDIIDDISLIEKLKKRPKIKVIAYNEPYYDFLKKELKNKIIYIPHPHINFENKKRVKNKSIVGGMISKATSRSYDIYKPIQKCLADIGIEFKECFAYETRGEMLDFYDQIDFQVVWYDQIPTNYVRFFRYPGKIVNAGSFGIPTIAQRILGHQEFEGDYIPAETYEDIAKAAVTLQDNDYYDKLSKRLIKRVAKFHISKIAKIYQKLK